MIKGVEAALLGLVERASLWLWRVFFFVGGARMPISLGCSHFVPGASTGAVATLQGAWEYAHTAPV